MGSFRENLKIGVFNFLNSVIKGVEVRGEREREKIVEVVETCETEQRLN